MIFVAQKHEICGQKVPPFCFLSRRHCRHWIWYSMVPNREGLTSSAFAISLAACMLQHWCHARMHPRNLQNFLEKKYQFDDQLS